MNNNKDNRVKERVVTWTSSQKSPSAKVKYIKQTKTDMKTKLKVLVLIGLGALAANQASAALVNGSFEDPNLSGSWATFTAIPGWTAVGTYPIEIGAGSIYGVTGYDGQQVMELDSTGNAIVDQIVLTGGANYNLSLLYALRANVAPASGTFDVKWNGILVAHFSPTSQAMTLYSTTVTAVNGNNTLELIGTGIQDTYGAIVDNVQLNAVPEPTTMIAGAGALGLALLGIGRARRSSVVRIGK
jgi:hypothetical protein